MFAILRNEKPHGGSAGVVCAAVTRALGHVGVDGAFVRIRPECPGKRDDGASFNWSGQGRGGGAAVLMTVALEVDGGDIGDGAVAGDFAVYAGWWSCI